MTGFICHSGIFLVRPEIERPRILPGQMPSSVLFPNRVGSLRQVLGPLPRGEDGRVIHQADKAPAEVS